MSVLSIAQTLTPWILDAEISKLDDYLSRNCNAMTHLINVIPLKKGVSADEKEKGIALFSRTLKSLEIIRTQVNERQQLIAGIKDVSDLEEASRQINIVRNNYKKLLDLIEKPTAEWSKK